MATPHEQDVNNTKYTQLIGDYSLGHEKKTRGDIKFSLAINQVLCEHLYKAICRMNSQKTKFLNIQT